MAFLYRIVAATLIVLAASPVTAPFTTCSALELLQALPGRRPSAAQAVLVVKHSPSPILAASAAVDPLPDPPVELRSHQEASHPTASAVVVSFVSDVAAAPVVLRSPATEPSHRHQRMFQAVTVLRV